MEYKFLKTEFIAFSGLLYNDCEEGSSQNVSIECVAHLFFGYEIGMNLEEIFSEKPGTFLVQVAVAKWCTGILES